MDHWLSSARPLPDDWVLGSSSVRLVEGGRVGGKSLYNQMISPPPPPPSWLWWGIQQISCSQLFPPTSQSQGWNIQQVQYSSERKRHFFSPSCKCDFLVHLFLISHIFMVLGIFRKFCRSNMATVCSRKWVTYQKHDSSLYQIIIDESAKKFMSHAVKHLGPKIIREIVFHRDRSSISLSSRKLNTLRLNFFGASKSRPRGKVRGNGTEPEF